MPNELPPATPGLVGDVGERAVAVVLVEGVLQRRLRREEVGRAAVDHEDVHPAVVVVVEERHARPHGLGQVSVGRHRVVVHPGDAARRRRDFFEDRPDGAKRRARAPAGRQTPRGRPGRRAGGSRDATVRARSRQSAFHIAEEVQPARRPESTRSIYGSSALPPRRRGQASRPREGDWHPPIAGCQSPRISANMGGTRCGVLPRAPVAQCPLELGPRGLPRGGRRADRPPVRPPATAGTCRPGNRVRSRYPPHPRGHLLRVPRTEEGRGQLRSIAGRACSPAA